MNIPIYDTLDTILHSFFQQDYDQFIFTLESNNADCRTPLRYTLQIQQLTGNKTTLSDNFNRAIPLVQAQANFNTFVSNNLTEMMRQRFEYFTLIKP